MRRLLTIMALAIALGGCAAAECADPLDELVIPAVY